MQCESHPHRGMALPGPDCKWLWLFGLARDQSQSSTAPCLTSDFCKLASLSICSAVLRKYISPYMVRNIFSGVTFANGAKHSPLALNMQIFGFNANVDHAPLLLSFWSKSQSFAKAKTFFCSFFFETPLKHVAYAFNILSAKFGKGLHFCIAGDTNELNLQSILSL